DILHIGYSFRFGWLALLGDFYAMLMCNSLILIGLALTRGNQVTQTASDVGTPCVRADVVAFVEGDEADVREVDFCFVTLPGDLKDNVGVLPLTLVFHKAKVVVQDVPGNLFTWNKFGDLDGA